MPVSDLRNYNKVWKNCQVRDEDNRLKLTLMIGTVYTVCIISGG